MPDVPSSFSPAALQEYHPLYAKVSSFEGPLAVLLAEVRRRKVDVRELSLASLTKPYLSWLDEQRRLNLEIGAEFLSVASTLIWIKSRSLLPSVENEESEEELSVEEVEAQLRERLIIYERFRQAAEDLLDRDLLGHQVFPRGVSTMQPHAAPQFSFEELSLPQLLGALRDVLRRAPPPVLRIVEEQTRLEDWIEHLMRALREGTPRSLVGLLPMPAGRLQIVFIFLAALELCRLGLLKLSQHTDKDPISCAPTQALRQANPSENVLPARMAREALREL